MKGAGARMEAVVEMRAEAPSLHPLGAGFRGEAFAQVPVAARPSFQARITEATSWSVWIPRRLGRLLCGGSGCNRVGIDVLTLL